LGRSARFSHAGVFGEGEAFVMPLVDRLTVLVSALLRR
jgi:hypothetical protein